MKCPFCVQPDGRAYKTKVIETRNYWEPNEKVFYVERRRECVHCEERFTTKEIAPKVKE